MKVMTSAGDDASSSHLSPIREDAGKIKEQEITASVARGTSLESNDGTFLSNRPMKLTLINC